VRLHDLRRAVATMLLGLGTHPKIVSEMLGHSSIAITLDTYSHVLPTMGDVAALAIRKAFSIALDRASSAM
jgi:integrase